jgi:hypothetical protein
MYRMQSALDARNRGQLAGLFTDLPSHRPRARNPEKLLARIRAALRGAGSRHAPGSQEPAWPPHHQGHRGSPAARLSGAAGPAPFVFPPGSGVRFTIGRTRDCDLCLTDLSVSRMHALLVRREDGWVLSDLGSHNGTRLNGWLVREPVPVRAGDRLEFGSMAFIIQGDPPPQAPAPDGNLA